MSDDSSRRDAWTSQPLLLLNFFMIFGETTLQVLNSDVQSSKLTKTSYSRILASSESWYCQVELKGKPM
ncbi:hypothetical protein JHK86_056445 [Glycine max]|nr:hypothetical protein JHK86_056445 [Glycine max]